MEPLNRRDLLRTVAALGVAAGAGRALEAQTVSDTTRFFPGFKSFTIPAIPILRSFADREKTCGPGAHISIFCNLFLNRRISEKPS